MTSGNLFCGLKKNNCENYFASICFSIENQPRDSLQWNPNTNVHKEDNKVAAVLV